MDLSSLRQTLSAFFRLTVFVLLVLGSICFSHSMESLSWPTTPIKRNYDFVVQSDYDYLLSTSENYMAGPEESGSFVGKYANERSVLDYSYHKHYSFKRQLFHDVLIDDFLDTYIEDGELICDRPTEVFPCFF